MENIIFRGSARKYYGRHFLAVGFSLILSCMFLCINVRAIDVATFEELSNAIANDESDIKLTQDLDFSASLTINSSIKIDGNGKQLSRAPGYLDGLFVIKAGAELSLDNIVIDGGAGGWWMDYENRTYTAPETNSGYIRVPTVSDSNDIIARAPLFSNTGSLVFNNVTIQNARLAQKNASNANVYGAVIYGAGNNTIRNSLIKHNGGYNNGALYITGGTTTIENSVTEGNVAGVGHKNSTHGGFMYMSDGNLIINESEFKDNFAQSNGGVAIIYRSNIEIKNSHFDHNMVGNDGSVFSLQSKVDGKTILVEDSIFENNIGFAVNGQSMGTIWQEAWYGTAETPVVYRNLIFRNNTVRTGAAISDYSSDETYVLIENIEVYENTVGSGGILYGQSGHYTIIEAYSHDNTGNSGLGVYNLAGDVTIENSVISDNTAASSGAGIYMAAGSVTIRDSEITDNSSDVRGGGIFVRGNHTESMPVLVVENTLITNNSAVTMGGGIAIADNEDVFSSITIDDKTRIYDNHAENMADDFSYVRQNGSENTTDNRVTLDNISIAGINGIDGWYYDNEDDRFSDTANPTVFYGYVENDGTIAFYLKAAGISSGDYDGNGGHTDAAPVTIKYGETYIVDDDIPTRDGYTFIEWNTKPDGSGTSLKAGDEYDGSDGWTLYAQWSPNPSKIIYDANEGEGTMPNTTGVVDETVQIAENAFTREGYTFIGWNTAADGSGTDYVENTDYILIPEDLILYAKWELIPIPKEENNHNNPNTVDHGIVQPMLLAVAMIIGASIVFRRYAERR